MLSYEEERVLRFQQSYASVMQQRVGGRTPDGVGGRRRDHRRLIVPAPAYPGKRAFDLAVIIVAAPVWIPVLAAVAVAVRLRLGSPVLFRQMRPGLGGKSFELWKFRTMTDERDANGRLLPDAERLTPFGQLAAEHVARRNS